MENVTVVENVETQPTAFVVPLGFNDPDADGVESVTWTALEKAEVGHKWYVNPERGGWGGNAVVVWRDDQRVVVLHENYLDAGIGGIPTRTLRAYAL